MSCFEVWASCYLTGFSVAAKDARGFPASNLTRAMAEAPGAMAIAASSADLMQQILIRRRICQGNRNSSVPAGYRRCPHRQVLNALIQRFAEPFTIRPLLYHFAPGHVCFIEG